MKACTPIKPGRSPAEVVRLVREFTSNELSISAGPAELRAEFDKFSNMIAGRYPFLVGYEIELVVQVDTASANMTAAYDGRRLLGTIQNLGLDAGGKVVHDGKLDGRRFRDAQAIVQGDLLVADPSDIPDADDTDLEVTVRLRVRFADLINPEHKRDGAIPCSLLRSKERVEDSLRFRLADALPGSPAGITGLTYTECRVRGIFRYEEDFVTTEVQRLVEQQFNKNQGTLEPLKDDREVRCYFAAVRYLDEDDDGLLVSNLGSVQISHGDMTWVDHRSVDEVGDWMEVVRGNPDRTFEPDDLNYQTQLLFLMGEKAGAQLSDLGRLPLDFEFDSLGNQSILRVLSMQSYAPDPAWVAKAMARWNIQRSDVGKVKAPKVRHIDPNLITQTAPILRKATA